MKKARLILSAALLTVGGFSTLTMTSCGKDEVICETGYEGDDCKTEKREKFIGLWSAQDTKVGGADLPAYVANITKNSGNISQINIGGFSGIPQNGGFVANVIASSDGQSFSIPTQEPDNDGYQVRGNATLDATKTKLTVEYTITEVSTNDAISYTGTWTKQ